MNFAFRHDSPDGALSAVELALPVLSDDYRRAFLTSAAAGLLRAHRRAEAAALLRRVLAVGDQPAAGRGVVVFLAEHYAQPELLAALDDAVTLTVTVPGAG